MKRRSRPVPDGAVWASRLSELARAVGAADPLAGLDRPSARDLATGLAAVVDLRDRAQVWLALATLSAQLPEDRDVVELTRACALDGPGALWRHVVSCSTPQSRARAVRVAVGEIVADVNHTVATDLATGIQRVARETVQRWVVHTACRPLAWTEDFGALRELTAVEFRRLLPHLPVPEHEPTVVVPWRSTVLVPELAAEHGRSGRLLSLARWSGNRTGVIGFDCVPLTSAETSAEGFASVFFGNLAAVRHFDRLAAISDAAATEYEGWRRMLGAVGAHGPDVKEILLASEAPTPAAEDLADARERFVVGDLPLVLVVGSHEPRKNHLAVLHAAELRWRAGDRFSLTFIGGNSWASQEFTAALADAQRAGRPVEAASKVPDRLLWAAYRLARFTVFPSLNEGFGLPVAESLAAGTPVVTSDYGSMREIAEHGGALLVDPRDDHTIAAALGRLLRDDHLLGELGAQARNRPTRSWDDYAGEVWAYLTEEPWPLARTSATPIADGAEHS
ncbi:glycosyltransferase [Cellulomonas sp. URHE0023]|uniref:glycosyltransferase n=1 Tax=Cellulomonas sp. URHE0023 TaxID=1380354 RepID=UPI0009DF96FA|nr:glycosyltransferase [Cellulomonas sp. URHE0023]